MLQDPQQDNGLQRHCLSSAALKNLLRCPKPLSRKQLSKTQHQSKGHLGAVCVKSISDTFRKKLAADSFIKQAAEQGETAGSSTNTGCPLGQFCTS